MAASGKWGLIGLGLEVAGGAAVNRWPEYAIPVMALGCVMIVNGAWGVWNNRRERHGKARVKLLPSHLLLIGIAGAWLFMTISLGAAAWMAWSGQGFAIGSSSISPGPDDGPMQWFRNLIMEGGPPNRSNVFSLKFRGVNVSQKEVELKSASIISAVNGTKLPLEIIAQNEIVPLHAVELIPPGAPVDLVAKFGPPDPKAPGKILGLDPKVFVETWRQFSLNVQDDSKVVSDSL